MTDEERQIHIDRLDKILKELNEFYECTQIFVQIAGETKEDGSIGWSRGIGSWFARYGQVKTWILNEEYLDSLRVKKEFEEGELS